MARTVRPQGRWRGLQMVRMWASPSRRGPGAVPGDERSKARGFAIVVSRPLPGGSRNGAAEGAIEGRRYTAGILEPHAGSDALRPSASTALEPIAVDAAWALVRPSPRGRGSRLHTTVRREQGRAGLAIDVKQPKLAGSRVEGDRPAQAGALQHRQVLDPLGDRQPQKHVAGREQATAPGSPVPFSPSKKPRSAATGHRPRTRAGLGLPSPLSR